MTPNPRSPAAAAGRRATGGGRLAADKPHCICRLPGAVPSWRSIRRRRPLRRRADAGAPRPQQGAPRTCPLPHPTCFPLVLWPGALMRPDAAAIRLQCGRNTPVVPRSQLGARRPEAAALPVADYDAHLPRRGLSTQQRDRAQGHQTRECARLRPDCTSPPLCCCLPPRQARPRARAHTRRALCARLQTSSWRWTGLCACAISAWLWTFQRKRP